MNVMEMEKKRSSEEFELHLNAYPLLESGFLCL